MNITLSIDKETVKKVRKIAIDRDTTLTAMVRGFLHSVADSRRIRSQGNSCQVDGLDSPQPPPYGTPSLV